MKRLNFILILTLVLLVANIVYAQGDPPEPPDGTNPGGSGPGGVDDVPINFLIFPFLVLGAYLGFLFKDKFSK